METGTSYYEGSAADVFAAALVRGLVTVRGAIDARVLGPALQTVVPVMLAEREAGYGIEGLDGEIGAATVPSAADLVAAAVLEGLTVRMQGPPSEAVLRAVVRETVAAVMASRADGYAVRSRPRVGA